MASRHLVVGLTLVLLAALGLAGTEEQLTCPDLQAQLAVRVLQCFNKSQVSVVPASPPGGVQLAPPAGQPARTTDGDLKACFAVAGQEIKTITALVPSQARGFVSLALSMFDRDSGLAFTVTYKDARDITPELKFSALTETSTVNNVFVPSSDVMAELNSMGIFVDLAPFISDDTKGEFGAMWQEIHPFVRQNLAIQDGRIVAAPFAMYLPYMYWRTDVFRKYNLTKPDTWEEVLEVARFLNRTNWDPRVRNKIPVCFPKPTISTLGTGSSHYMLISILGSMTQHQGRAHGLLFDPLSMEPLVNNSAMARALEIYQELATLMPDPSTDRGGAYDANTQPIMSGGWCALGFRWADQFKLTAFSSYLKGNLGVSIMPGSTRVLDRANDLLVDCTAQLCRGSDAIVRRDPITGTSVTRFVNRVSYASLNVYSVSINKYSSLGYQEASYQVASYIGTTLLGRNDDLLYSVLTPFGPIKTKHISLDPSVIAAWPAVYNKTDVHAFLSATLDVIAHPNTLTDLKMSSQAQVKVIMNDAARLVERDGKAAIPAIMAQASMQLSAIASDYQPGGLQAFRATYWHGIGFVPPAPPPPPPPSPAPSPELLASSSDESSRQAMAITGASVGVGVTIVAVVVVSAVLLLRRRSKHLTLMGKVVPPGLGPTTTLVVTDIQSSTTLWDTLPQDVMETSVALHFAILRSVAHAHGGYESATEGDSIILGFHDAVSACEAAVQAQADLMSADWPAGLLGHPLCTPKYAVPAVATEQNADQHGDGAESVTRLLPPFPLWDAGSLLAAQCLPADEDNTPHSEQKSSWRTRSFAPRETLQSSVWRSALSMLPSSKAPPRPSSPFVTATSKSFAFLWSSRNGASKNGDTANNNGRTEEPPGSFSSVAEHLLSLVALSDWPLASAGVSSLLFQGLRVRIGVHTGVTDEGSVITNQGGRVAYAGQPLAMATAVSSAGHGCMTLLSEATFSQLDGVTLAAQGLLLAHMGLNQLLDVDDPVQLYQAVTPQLAYRVCFNTQLRHSQQLSPSFLDAPHGQTVVCFINVAGLALLNAWSTTITQASIQLYQNVATTELVRQGGYMVNTSAGLFLAAFKDPAQAIRWALMTLQQCLEADWDPALLEHELGEEMVVGHNVEEAEEAPMDVSAVNHLHDIGTHQQHFDQSSTIPPRDDVLSGQPSSATPNEDLIGASRPPSSLAMLGRISNTSVHSTMPRVKEGGQQSGILKTIIRKTVFFRGLRLKCGVDVGQATASIDPSTGRIMYFGRILNRCARVCAVTKTGQVWCTQGVWDLAAPTINSRGACSVGAGNWQDQCSFRPPLDIPAATTAARLRAHVSHLSLESPTAAGVVMSAASVTSAGEGPGGEARTSLFVGMYRPALLVAGVPLGTRKLRGIQESASLLQCRFDDQSVVQVNNRAQAPRPKLGAIHTSFHQSRTTSFRDSSVIAGTDGVPDLLVGRTPSKAVATHTNRQGLVDIDELYPRTPLGAVWGRALAEPTLRPPSKDGGARSSRSASAAPFPVAVDQHEPATPICFMLRAGSSPAETATTPHPADRPSPSKGWALRPSGSGAKAGFGSGPPSARETGAESDEAASTQRGEPPRPGRHSMSGLGPTSAASDQRVVASPALGQHSMSLPRVPTASRFSLGGTQRLPEWVVEDEGVDSRQSSRSSHQPPTYVLIPK